MLECENQMSNTTESSLDDKNETFKKVIVLLHDFISNYMLMMIIYCFYCLLLLLHERTSTYAHINIKRRI